MLSTMGRTSDARDKILDAATALIAQRGYSALGVAEICAEARVPKGSFYYFFPSKQALALAVIERHWEVQRGQWEDVLGGDRAPLERLRSLFEATAQMQQGAHDDLGAVTGCLFGNLALEMSTQDQEVRARLQDIFQAQIEMVDQVVTIAAASGDVHVDDTRNAARAIVAQLEGLVLFAKLLNDPAQLDVMWRSSLALLGVPASAPLQTAR